MAIFASFLGSVCPASHVQHISDLHSIHSATADIRRGKKKIEDKKKPQDENIMACPIP